ncbi:hypothetical protein ABS71_19715 [bacterium SCN 62-11]|nr:hypothetical protein [Candidatus Eremiobacteraeota bacterium]ODT57535.1 MAG: hypothetical protein ABS71_19715 [bacterium SCN 62-11]
MFKKILCVTSLTAAVLGLGLPASADIRVDSIVVNQSAPTPEGTNIRVNLMNDGSLRQRPSVVELQARDNATQTWHTVKSWNWDKNVAPGDKLALDFLPARDEALDTSLQQPTYELRAVVMGASGPMTSFEYQYSPGVEVR